MEILASLPTRRMPEIRLDPQACTLSFRGIALPESSSFFIPHIEWMSELLSTKPQKIVLYFYMLYHNGTFNKFVNRLMLMCCKHVKEHDCLISIVWHYAEEDADMMEIGEDYAELFPELYVYLIEVSEEEAESWKTKE